MVLPAERANSIFRKTKKALLRLSEGYADSDALHGFRTAARRLEILLTRILPDIDRNEKKLLKTLARFRRLAGKVRDSDLELAALRKLKISQEPRRKTQLMQQLIELRAAHEKQLRKRLNNKEINEIEKRLKKAAKKIDLARARDPMGVARQVLDSAKIPAGEVSYDALHRYRTAVKRARYAAEFAPKSAASARLVSRLKRLQDALGDWHDWLMVTQAAEENLGEATHSSLLAALRNLTRGKYRQALASISNQHGHFADPEQKSSQHKKLVSTTSHQSQVAA